MSTIKKILIANRGEIALRVIRTCKELGIKTVAVYSRPDAEMPHVLNADESIFLGEAKASESYLNMDKILNAAKTTGADAIHPGYGFLSENAAFAERCKEEDIIFIGPDPDSIRMMGDKTKARELMDNSGVPYPPGTPEAIQDVDEAEKKAEEIGFPVLIKAAAGGGGKGMRIVHEKKDFKSSLRGAKSEANNAFGDDRVYIEKYLENPRHVEFQIIADRHDNVLHVFDRECSVQRRHQKVIEEAPCSILTPDMRQEMAEAATAAARACNYVNAGTVEFLLDADLNFYFLEMNTRLQVEHPVTELVTGLDLVEQMIRIAAGEKLPFTQKNIQYRGHAIEARINAEDPYANRDPRFYANVLYNTAEWRPRPAGLQDLDPVGVMQTGWFEMPGQAALRPGLDTREGPVQTWNGTKTGYNLRKFVDRDVEPDKAQAYNPWPNLRYAEVLLNYAEAAAELGHTQEAVNALNEVRERVGMPAVPADGGPNRTLMDRIRLEREIELAFEDVALEEALAALAKEAVPPDVERAHAMPSEWLPSEDVQLDGRHDHAMR